MNPCTGRQWLHRIWWLSRPRCVRKTLMMRNGFSVGVLSCCWQNVQARFRSREKGNTVAIWDPRRIWQSAWASKREVVS
jgi:hypothetical protein